MIPCMARISLLKGQNKYDGLLLFLHGYGWFGSNPIEASPTSDSKKHLEWHLRDTVAPEAFIYLSDNGLARI